MGSVHTTAQILYQTSILGGIYLKGDAILHTDDEEQKQSFIFNTWVLCQAFFYTSTRDHHNGQSLRLRIGLVLMVLFLLAFFNFAVGMSSMRWQHWGACVAIAAMSWPISWLYSPFHKLLQLIQNFGTRKKHTGAISEKLGYCVAIVAFELLVHRFLFPEGKIELASKMMDYRFK